MNPLRLVKRASVTTRYGLSWAAGWRNRPLSGIEVATRRKCRFCVNACSAGRSGRSLANCVSPPMRSASGTVTASGLRSHSARSACTASNTAATSLICACATVVLVTLAPRMVTLPLPLMMPSTVLSAVVTSRLKVGYQCTVSLS
ncbi:Uncharacterised protein [Achromobacter xylosoxidans]|nr:Uncharacterised protein [Achromobacter xylosoxidans]